MRSTRGLPCFADTPGTAWRYEGLFFGSSSTSLWRLSLAVILRRTLPVDLHANTTMLALPLPQPLPNKVNHGLGQFDRPVCVYLVEGF